MEVDKYTRVLHTIEVLLGVLQAETTNFIPELGPMTQSVWDGREEREIKRQLLGMLKLIPDAKVFNQTFDNEG